MLMAMHIFESMLRAIVCSNFTGKALFLKTRSKKIVLWFQILYYFFIIALLITLACLTFVIK